MRFSKREINDQSDFHLKSNYGKESNIKLEYIICSLTLNQPMTVSTERSFLVP